MCVVSHSVGRLWKSWIDTVKDCLKKGLDVRQARRMVQDRSEWPKFLRGNAGGCSLGNELQTLMRCHSYMKPLKGGTSSVAEPTT